MNWYAVTHPGLEPVVARELEGLGAPGTVMPGGVRFAATLLEGAALLPRLRTPSRLLLELAEATVRSGDELAGMVRRIPWKTYLLPDANIEVQASVKSSKLHFKDSIQKKVAWNVREALKGPRVVDRTPRGTVVQRVAVRIDEDKATISLDAGGELLHFRGWRTEQGPASLRENLAAAMLFAAGWTGDEPLVDPFCGAGTIPIEAALLASGRSPYARRQFACSEWPVLAKERPVKIAAPVPITVPIQGSDRDNRIVETAIANAKRAGVSVTFQHCDVADIGPPSAAGLVITNPPYGKRLGEGAEGRAYTSFGQTLRGRFEGWRVLFLSPTPGLAAKVHRDAVRMLTFSNGGVKVGMYAIEVVR